MASRAKWLRLARNGACLFALSLVFNVPFVLFGVPRSAFDTYPHLFLADHYRSNWWSLWEPRWYLGFSMASYPPLVHQLIALLSWPLGGAISFFQIAPEPYLGASRLLSEEAAYVALMLVALGLFPLAVRSLARVFVGPRAAALAAGLSIFLPALSLSAWAFGQLPTVLATTLALGALARGAAFVQRGRGRDLAQAVGLAALMSATHHGVFLMLPFVGGAVALRLMARPWTISSRPPYVAPRSADFKVICLRLALWVGGSALAALLVLWPFLAWSRGQTMQAPIDHLSRHNLLTEPLAAWFFFWPAYGPLVIAMPLAVWCGLHFRRLWPLLVAFGLLFVLGLGGSTPLPKLFFGAGWEWLTYDRFNFWAAILLLPLAAAAGLWLRRRWRVPGRPYAIGLAVWGLVLIGWAVATGWWSIINRSQPAAVDLAPLASFLDAPEQKPYRYLTLGFGDQFAKLSALTTNGSPDGDYHTARQLPELRASGLGALDTAVWTPQGAWAVLPFLQQAQSYGMRWVFVNHPLYVPVLRAAGWQFRFYVGQVGAWENPAVAPLPVSPPDGMNGSTAALWWGIAPLTAVLLTGLAFAVNWRIAITRAELIRGLAIVRTAGFGATVILLVFWWVHIVWCGSSPTIYFTYQSWLIFASDAAALVTLLSWGVERVLRQEPLALGPRSVAGAGLGLLAAVVLSAAVSVDRVLTLGYVIHLLLLAGLYLLCLNDAPSSRQLAWLCGGVLLVEAGSAFLEVGLQSTHWLQFLALPWPGALTPDIRGASVVENLQGVRWLRAYGTLPHPNTLGGILLVYLGGVTARYFETGRKGWLAVLALGVGALALAFSRGAWLGAAAMAVGSLLLMPRDSFVRRRNVLLVGVGVMALCLLPLWSFLIERASAGQDGLILERRSIIERTRLLGVSLDMIRAHPLLGNGTGTFVEVLAHWPRPIWPPEPVHNVPVLMVTEMGVPGVLALAGLAIAMGRRLWQRRSVASATEATWALVCLGIITAGMFDHFWWTSPPPRMLMVLALALWVHFGQAAPAPHTASTSSGSR